MTAKPKPIVINECFGAWREIEPKTEYERCAGRDARADCETTPSGKESSCVWVVDPKGPQGSYCRGSSEIQRS